MGRAIRGLRSAVVGDSNGLPVVAIRRGHETLSATAMATLLLSAADRAADTMELRGLRDVLVEGEGWFILVSSLGHGFTLSCIVDGSTDLGLLRAEIRRRAIEIKVVLERIR